MTTTKNRGTLSAGVIRYLQAQGLTQREIARKMAVTESFISHVVKGNRNFTLEHLEKLAISEEMTLPELLALATPIETVPKEHQKAYELFLAGLKASNDLRNQLKQKEKRSKTSLKRRVG
ncbi:MAG: helix-turn-helix transcriptional regulator [Phycisphaerae bacterium]|nr:helix-turn-helix transcriptional regulator [Phycisphaerae bacterium]